MAARHEGGVLQPALTASFRRQQIRRIRGPVRRIDLPGAKLKRPKTFGEKLYDWAFPAETPDEQRWRDYRRQLADDFLGQTDEIMSLHYGGKGDRMAQDNKLMGEIGKHGKTEEEAWRNYCAKLFDRDPKDFK